MNTQRLNPKIVTQFSNPKHVTIISLQRLLLPSTVCSVSCYHHQSAASPATINSLQRLLLPSSVCNVSCYHHQSAAPPAPSTVCSVSCYHQQFATSPAARQQERSCWSCRGQFTVPFLPSVGSHCPEWQRTVVTQAVKWQYHRLIRGSFIMDKIITTHVHDISIIKKLNFIHESLVNIYFISVVKLIQFSSKGASC